MSPGHVDLGKQCDRKERAVTVRCEDTWAGGNLFTSCILATCFFPSSLSLTCYVPCVQMTRKLRQELDGDVVNLIEVEFPSEADQLEAREFLVSDWWGVLCQVIVTW